MVPNLDQIRNVLGSLGLHFAPDSSQPHKQCLMLLLSAFALLAASAFAATHDVKVIPNAVSNADLTLLAKHVASQQDAVSSSRSHGSISLQTALARALQQAVGLEGSLLEGSVQETPTTVLTGSTQPHVDSHSTTQGHDTVILFTNTNPDAYLSIQDEKVPVQAGSLVRFAGGSVPHHTVVQSGHVSFVGPFNIQTFGRVGCNTKGQVCNGDSACCSNECVAGACTCSMQGQFCFRDRDCCDDTMECTTANGLKCAPKPSESPSESPVMAPTVDDDCTRRGLFGGGCK